MNVIPAGDDGVTYRSICEAEYLSTIDTCAGCVLPPGYRLLRLQALGADGQSDEIHVVLVNDVEGSVVYQSTLTALPLSLHSRPIALQRKVWCSTEAQHAAVLHDLSNKICFNYLLTSYDLLVSPDLQRDLSEHRWLRCLSTALAHGAYVYLYDMAGSVQPIRTQVELSEAVDRLWPESDGPSPLALISQTNVLTSDVIMCQSSSVLKLLSQI